MQCDAKQADTARSVINAGDLRTLALPARCARQLCSASPRRGKAKAREAARGAPRSPNHSHPGPPDRPHRLATPCRVRCGVRPATRCRVRPVPFFRLSRLSELGIPVPAPAPSARRLPFATAPARRLRPFAPAAPHASRPASRRNLSRLSYFPPARDSPLPAACASSRFPLHRPAPAASSYERPPHVLRPCRTARSPEKDVPTTNK